MNDVLDFGVCYCSLHVGAKIWPLPNRPDNLVGSVVVRTDASCPMLSEFRHLALLVFERQVCNLHFEWQAHPHCDLRGPPRQTTESANRTT